jgi:hypothetical protein
MKQDAYKDPRTCRTSTPARPVDWRLELHDRTGALRIGADAGIAQDFALAVTGGQALSRITDDKKRYSHD